MSKTEGVTCVVREFTQRTGEMRVKAIILSIMNIKEAARLIGNDSHCFHMSYVGKVLLSERDGTWGFMPEDEFNQKFAPLDDAAMKSKAVDEARRCDYEIRILCALVSHEQYETEFCGSEAAVAATIAGELISIQEKRSKL